MNLSSVRRESKKGQILSNSNKNSPVSSTHTTFCGGIGYKLMNNKVTYRQQFTRCGKQRCRKCKEGMGHGPYWYAYWSENGRTISKYIGIHPPAGIELTPGTSILSHAQPSTVEPGAAITTSAKHTISGVSETTFEAINTTPTQTATEMVPR